MDIFTVLLAMILVNLVVDAVCRLVAPRTWGRSRCLGMILVDAVPVLMVTKLILDLATHRVDGMAGIVFLPGLLLLVELLWLIMIYQTCYWRRPPPSSNNQWQPRFIRCPSRPEQIACRVATPPDQCMSHLAAQTSPGTCFHLGLLGINALVALTCLIAGPRVWVRRLGAAFVVGNGPLILAVTALLTHFALTTDLHRAGATASLMKAADGATTTFSAAAQRHGTIWKFHRVCQAQ